MRQILSGHQIGQALCEALGLPKHTRSFELRCAVDEIVTVKCEYYPEVSSQMLASTLAAFEVVQREPPAQLAPERIDFDAWLNQQKDEAHAAMMARHAALSRMDEQAQAFSGLMRWAHA